MTKFYFKSIFFITVFIVLYLSMAPNPEIDISSYDKINHFIAFFTLSFLLNRSSSSYEKRFRNVISLIAFGIFIEVAQAFTYYRSSSVGDVVADVVGIFMFQILYSAYKYHRYGTV